MMFFRAFVGRNFHTLEFPLFHTFLIIKKEENVWTAWIINLIITIKIPYFQELVAGSPDEKNWKVSDLLIYFSYYEKYILCTCIKCLQLHSLVLLHISSLCKVYGWSFYYSSILQISVYKKKNKYYIYLFPLATLHFTLKIC